MAGEHHKKPTHTHGRTLAESTNADGGRVIEIFAWHTRKVYGKGRKNEGMVQIHRGETLVWVRGDVRTLAAMVETASGIIADMNAGSYTGEREIEI